MPHSCVAVGCFNTSYKASCIDRNISFHRFPLKDPVRLTQWLLNVRRKNFTPNIHSVLCSEHFSKDYFQHKKRLKRDAVPTIFPHAVLTQNEKTCTSETPSHVIEDKEPIVCYLSRNSYDKSTQTDRDNINDLLSEIQTLRHENFELRGELNRLRAKFLS